MQTVPNAITTQDMPSCAVGTIPANFKRDGIIIGGADFVVSPSPAILLRGPARNVDQFP